jgi:hypothetical protein
VVHICACIYCIHASALWRIYALAYIAYMQAHCGAYMQVYISHTCKHIVTHICKCIYRIHASALWCIYASAYIAYVNYFYAVPPLIYYFRSTGLRMEYLATYKDLLDACPRLQADLESISNNPPAIRSFIAYVRDLLF